MPLEFPERTMDRSGSHNHGHGIMGIIDPRTDTRKHRYIAHGGIPTLVNSQHKSLNYVSQTGGTSDNVIEGTVKIRVPSRLRTYIFKLNSAGPIGGYLRS